MTINENSYETIEEVYLYFINNKNEDICNNAFL